MFTRVLSERRLDFSRPAGHWAALRILLCATLWFVSFSSAAQVVSKLLFIGTVGYTALSPYATLTANQIANQSAGGYSGTIRMELWAFPSPYIGNVTFGYKLAQYQLAQLTAGYVYNNVNSGLVLYSLPPTGTWYYSMLLTEYDGGSFDSGYSPRDWANFSVPVTVGVVTPIYLSQTITFLQPANQTLGAGDQILIASASSGLPVTFTSVTPNICRIVAGFTVSLVAAGTCTINAGQAGNATYYSAPTVSRSFVVSPMASVSVPNYSDLWWAGAAENGWGLSIQQHGLIQFNALYVYDNVGKPVWYVMPGGSWNANYTTFSGLLYQPTSAPLSNYLTNQFVVGASPGSMSITFTSASTALLQYTINGVSGQKSVQRQLFGSGVAPLTVGDMWWAGGAQDGWGINISQQGANLFGVWYTYGPDGKVTWYVLPNGNWSGTTYSGPFYSTVSSAWVGTTYQANLLSVTQAGTMSLIFSGANNATMTYSFTSGPFAGITQSKQIGRQAY